MTIGSLAEWASALGTILAFFAAIRAIRMQSTELALQREELALQRQELARNVATQEQLAQVELERLLAEDDSAVATSVAGSFIHVRAEGPELVISVENRSNWRVSDLQLVFFGWTEHADELVYQWPSKQIITAYDEPVTFVDPTEDAKRETCNCSATVVTDASVAPLGTEVYRAPRWDDRVSVSGYVLTFVSAGRRWIATNSGGWWGEQLSVEPLPIGGPYKVAKHCRENSVHLLRLSKGSS